MQQQAGDYDFEPYPHDYAPQRGGTNGLGIAGFILAFCVPPIGFLLCLLALFRPPRGLAVAGLVISTLIMGCVGAGGYFMWPIFRDINEVTMDTVRIGDAIDRHANRNNGELPADLSVLGLSSDALTDPWGNPYRYELDGAGGWRLLVAGPDGSFDDHDTMVVVSGMTPQEISQLAGDTFGEALARKAMGEPARSRRAPMGSPSSSPAPASDAVPTDEAPADTQSEDAPPPADDSSR